MARRTKQTSQTAAIADVVATPDVAEIAHAAPAEIDDAMVDAYLARRAAKEAADKAARDAAITEATARVVKLRVELAEATSALALLAPAKGRALAMGRNPRVVARSAGNDLGLSGKNLELYRLLTQPDGVSDREGSEAVGWTACAATLSKIMALASSAGLGTRKTKGVDGRTRYQVVLPA